MRNDFVVQAYYVHPEAKPMPKVGTKEYAKWASELVIVFRPTMLGSAGADLLLQQAIQQQGGDPDFREAVS